MAETKHRKRLVVLIAGDFITITLVTLFGFITHGTLQTSGTRVLTTLLPMLIGWFAVAPFLSAYDLDRAKQVNQIWRPFWAMVISAPFSAWMRGFWLNSAIQPLFVLVMGGFAAFAILLWRLVFYAAIKFQRAS